MALTYTRSVGHTYGSGTQERAHLSQDQGAQKLVRGTPRHVDSYTFGLARALPIMTLALPMVTWALPKFDPSETLGNANDT